MIESVIALGPGVLAAMVAVTIAGSFVKGAIGFAMPMIMISGFATLLPPGPALAALIVPTLLANIWQALRGGAGQIGGIVWEYRVYIAIVLVSIAVSAQLVTRLPGGVMYLLLALPIVGFSSLQLAGWRPRIAPHRRWRADLGIGLAAGLSGGLSGVWGPPTVLYLTAIDAPKARSVAVQGVVYASGAVVLLGAHLRSGVLNEATLPLSFAMVPPMIVGMWLGQRVQDRLDQAAFRRWTLVVLIVAGLNLLRRAVSELT